MSLDINGVLLLIMILLGFYLIYKKCILETFQDGPTSDIIEVPIDDATVYDGNKIYPLDPNYDNSSPYTDINDAELYISRGYDDPRLSYKCPNNYPLMKIWADDPLLQIHRCIKSCNTYPDCSGGNCEDDGNYCILKSDLAAFNQCDETGMMPDGRDWCVYNVIPHIGDRFQKDYVIPDAYTPVEKFENIKKPTKKSTKKPTKKPTRKLAKVKNQRKCVCPVKHYTDTKKCYKPCNSQKGQIEGVKNKTVCKNSSGRFFKKSTTSCLKK